MAILTGVRIDWIILGAVLDYTHSGPTHALFWHVVPPVQGSSFSQYGQPDGQLSGTNKLVVAMRHLSALSEHLLVLQAFEPTSTSPVVVLPKFSQFLPPRQAPFFTTIV